MAEANVYFENIKSVLTQELGAASKCLKIAVAWLNDPALFEIILKKANEIVVELLVINDSLNNTAGNNFEGFISCRFSELYLAEPAKLMHHKFAIIDNDKVITGSYNWTRGARNNHENIIVIQNPRIVQNYYAEFDSLKSKYGPKVDDYATAKNIETDTANCEAIAEIPVEEMLLYNLLPFSIGVKTHTESFAAVLSLNEPLPISQRKATYNTVNPKQRSFDFEIKKRQAAVETTVGIFNFEFSELCLMPDTPKATVFFSVSSNAELVVEVNEIGGSRSTTTRYNLLSI